MRRSRRIVLWAALLFVVASVAGGGAFLADMTVFKRGVTVPGKTPLKQEEAAFAQLFAEGVAYLQAGRSHEALVVLLAAQKLNPHVPEVHVNKGFALLDSGNKDEALKSFERALDLKPDQANAYWGLYLILLDRNDNDGALGMLRTYMHLMPPNDPHFRRAMAAQWELEARLGKMAVPPIPNVESLPPAKPPQGGSGEKP
jgi:tetratricopeptide (TPR) repeat protein